MDSYISSWKKDEEFLEIYKKFNSIVGIQDSLDTAFYARLYILRQLAKQQSGKGNFAECGIYAGMSMFYVADLCKNKFVGVDSFEGVSKPDKNDSSYFNNKNLAIDIHYAKSALSNFNNVLIYKGWIPEVFSELDEDTYAYVNIDVDLYMPTKESIEYFWPKIIKGGVLICDDFGSEKTIGARKAVIDYFGDNILELPTGQAIVYKI